MSLQDWVSMVIGLGGFLGGLVLWYRGAVEKQYASQRDFAHLRRNQEQLLQNIGVMSEDLDDAKRAALDVAHKTDILAQNIEAMNRVLIEQKSLSSLLTSLLTREDFK